MLQNINLNAGHRQRLRKRFAQHGFEVLEDYEVLELLLMQSIQRRDVKILAKNLIRHFKTFSGVLDADFHDLIKVAGIGETTAHSIKLSLGVATFYRQQKVKNTPKVNDKIKLLDYLYTKLSGLKHEEFHVVYLDNKHKIVHDECLFKGTIDKSVAYPREVIKSSLKYGATGIIMVHNHPSGDPSPSIADNKLTLAVEEAVIAMNIKLHDHIIVGDKIHYSYEDHGKL